MEVLQHKIYTVADNLEREEELITPGCYPIGQ
jgi:hypothetical protein